MDNALLVHLTATPEVLTVDADNAALNAADASDGGDKTTRCLAAVRNTTHLFNAFITSIRDHDGLMCAPLTKLHILQRKIDARLTEKAVLSYCRIGKSEVTSELTTLKTVVDALDLLLPAIKPGSSSCDMLVGVRKADDIIPSDIYAVPSDTLQVIFDLRCQERANARQHVLRLPFPAQK